VPEIFSRRAQLGAKLVATSLVVVIVFLLLIALSATRAATVTGAPPQQPVPFSHKHHVGDVGIDCRYCHTTVETTAFAGMPSTRICLGCHAQLFRDASILAPLHRSAASGRPIGWTVLHKLPDFVYFDHSIHIAKGVGCVECHGRVDQMPLEWRTARLQMQWCLDCHRNPAPHLRSHDEVFSMTPPSSPSPHAPQISLQSRSRLTDCSTCHR
jgi:hypothetical protein